MTPATIFQYIRKIKKSTFHINFLSSDGVSVNSGKISGLKSLLQEDRSWVYFI